MGSLRIRATNPAPAIGEQAEIRIELSDIPSDIAVVINFHQVPSRGSVTGLPSEFRFPPEQRSVAFRVTCESAGTVLIRARSNPFQTGLRIPDLRHIDVIGRAGARDPIVLQAEISFKIRPVLPRHSGACTKTDSLLMLDTEKWSNWFGNHKKSLSRVTLGLMGETMAERVSEVVQAVQFAEENGLRPGIQGTAWSYTECVVGENTTLLINTSQLNHEWNEILDQAVASSGGDHRYLHVEAGIKIHQLNCVLDSKGLAMPTLGGSRGQSLAGVIGTGVHGSDISEPPIADAVRAIHLVGPGGQEWWIESERYRITDPLVMARLREDGTFCRNIRIEYSDDLFNSVLVSMGCAGIIYSVVLAARDRFNLHTIRSGFTWDDARRVIASIAAGTAREDYIDINVSGANASCRITRRTVTRNAVTATASSTPTILDVASVVGFIGPGALAELVAEATRIIAQLAAIIPRLLANPLDVVALGELATIGISPASAEATLANLRRYFELLTSLPLAELGSGDPARVADVLPKAINYAWTLGSFARSGRVVVDALQHQLTLATLPDEDSVKTSHGARTGQTLCPEDEQFHSEVERLVESFEFAVDAANAINFVERILAIVSDMRGGLDALVVNVNLRFTGATRAILGMQQFERTCHVEVYTFKGIAANGLFHERLNMLASEVGAIPHWGQLHASSFDFARVFGDKLSTWRWAMNYVATGSSGVRDLFWTDFARTRRLLSISPMPEMPGIQGLAVEKDASGLITVFGIGLGGLWLLEQREQNDDFGPWQGLNKPVKQVALSTGADGQLRVFARGDDNQVHHSSRLPGDRNFKDWSELGGIVKQIAVGRNQDGRLEVFGIGGNDALHHIYQLTPNGGWSGWSSMGGIVKQIAVGRNQDGRLEVFGIGGNDALHHIYQLAPNGGWSGWSSMGGVVKQIAVGRNQDGRLEVFGIGGNDALHHIYQLTPNGGWSGWSSMGGIVKQIAVGRNQDGRLEVFGIGGNDALHHIYQLTPNGGWSGWSSMGGVVKQIAVANNQDGRLQAFAVGLDDALYQIAQVTRNNGWGSWGGLGLPTR
jgi:hypothetical protein